MVSFQTPFFLLNQSKTISESNSKKRKWDHDHDTQPEEILPYKHWKTPKEAAVVATTTARSFSDIELHLETPLPSEWQRCLDIQSGEIHFYNTRTQKRTLRDPRSASPEPPSSPTPRDSDHMSLDLELNLPCGSLNHNSSSERTTPMTKKISSNNAPATPAGKKSSTNTIAADVDDNDDDDQAVEMVATACMRCHMLVMLCKSAPTCPNCKFVHPPYQSPPDLFKPRLSLSC